MRATSMQYCGRLLRFWRNIRYFEAHGCCRFEKRNTPQPDHAPVAGEPKHSIKPRRKNAWEQGNAGQLYPRLSRISNRITSTRVHHCRDLRDCCRPLTSENPKSMHITWQPRSCDPSGALVT